MLRVEYSRSPKVACVLLTFDCSENGFLFCLTCIPFRTIESIVILATFAESHPVLSPTTITYTMYKHYTSRILITEIYIYICIPKTLDSITEWCAQGLRA
jgi:hypothetical protein